MKRDFIIHVFTVMLAMAMLCSCVGEENLQHKEISLPSDRQLTLHLFIPGTNAPVTFAYSQAGENEVRTVDILAFKVDEQGEHYYKHIPVGSVQSDNNTSKKLDITLDAIDVRLVLLANVSHLFTQEMMRRLEHDAAAGDVTKHSVLERFVFDFDSPWRADAFQSDRAFPMYGESEIIPARSNAPKEIKMLRAIARIDVANEIRSTSWHIDSIYVFNTKSKGFVAPAFDSKGSMLETANIPSSAQSNKAAFGYSFVQNAGTSTPSMEREIYITEDSQEGSSPTTIVLRMTRENKAPQFFCVDLKDADGKRTPILRNCRYRIFIKSITGDGYATAEEAFAMAHSSHISTEVEMNELGLSNIVFNSKYKMGVSEAQINFDSRGRWEGMSEGDVFYALKVYTTYSSWTVTFDQSLAEWLKVADCETEGLEINFPAAKHSLDLIAKPNDTGHIRAGRLQIKSGNLRLEVIIIQDGKQD